MIMSQSKRVLACSLAALLHAFPGSVIVTGASSAADPKSEAPIELTLDSYIPDWTENPTTKCVNRFFLDHPNIAVRPFSSLKLPGALGQSDTTKLMAFAAGIGPDIVHCWFHKLEAFQHQGFLLDLAELIGEDRDGDGYISDSEAKWDGWKLIPPSYRRAITIDGKPYASSSSRRRNYFAE